MEKVKVKILGVPILEKGEKKVEIRGLGVE